MASESEIQGAFAKVSANFPIANYETPATLRLVLDTWIEVLSDIPGDVLSAAVTQRLSEDREWRPTPGQVRETAIVIMSPERPLPHDAIDDHSDELSKQVHAGFKRWEWQDEPNRTRMRFMKCYREAVDREREELRRHPETVRVIGSYAVRRIGEVFKEEPRQIEARKCSSCGSPDVIRARDDRGRCMECVAKARANGEFERVNYEQGPSLESIGDIATRMMEKSE